MTNVDPQPKKRTILGADGELREELDVPSQAPIFCTQCGSSNPPDANFCWKCGKTLSAAVPSATATQSQPKRKVKNEELFEDDDEDELEDDGHVEMDWRSMREASKQAKKQYKLSRRESRREARAQMLNAPLEGLSAGGMSALLSVITMIFVAGMTITSLVLNGGSNSWISIFVFLGWFLVEGARRALRRAMTVPAFVLELFTMICVSGMVITSLTLHGGSNTWVSIFALVGWFLVEGARGALERITSAAGVVTDMGIVAMVSGMVVTALTLSGGSNAWLSIPILIGWFLVEGARKTLKHEN